MIHILLFQDTYSEDVGPSYMICGFIGDVHDDGSTDPEDLDFIGDGGVVTGAQLVQVTCEECRKRAVLKAVTRSEGVAA